MNFILNNINKFSFILAPIFYKIVYMSIIASIVAIVIVILKKLLKRYISPKWMSRIWITFLLTLIIPITIKTKFSIYNYLPNSLLIFNTQIDSVNNISYRQLYDDIKLQMHNLIEQEEINDISQIEKQSNNIFLKSLVFDVILPYIWLITSLLLILIYFITYIVFSLKNNRNNVEDKRINKILNKCKELLNIKKDIKVINQDYIIEPSIFGIINVRILINKEILKLSDKEIEYIFMHELAHYKRRDNILIIIISILKYVYFFNPVIFFMLKQWINDIEFSTDAIAVNKNSEEENREYLKLMVNITNNRKNRFMSNSLCMSDSKNNLENRIKMVKLVNRFKKEKIYVAFCSIIIIISIFLVFATSKVTNNIDISTLDEIVQEGTISIKQEKDIQKLVYKLPFSKFISKIKLDNVVMPYDISIVYNTNINSKNLEYNNLVLFSAIPELELVKYSFLDGKVEYKREEILENEYITLQSLDTYINSKYCFKNNLAYSVTFNENGVICFKNTGMAFNTFKKEYKEAIEYIKNQYNLNQISKWNYEAYKTYGWQVVSDDSNMKRMCNEVSKFLDIYENGYLTYEIIEKYPFIPVSNFSGDVMNNTQELGIIANLILREYFYELSKEDIMKEQKVDNFIPLKDEIVAGDKKEFVAKVNSKLSVSTDRSLYGQVNNSYVDTIIMVRIKREEIDGKIKYNLVEIGDMVSLDGLNVLENTKIPKRSY